MNNLWVQNGARVADLRISGRQAVRRSPTAAAMRRLRRLSTFDRRNELIRKVRELIEGAAAGVRADHDPAGRLRQGQPVATPGRTRPFKPKLRVVRMSRPPLACAFALSLVACSGYLRSVSGIGASMSWNAWCCSLVGSVGPPRRCSCATGPAPEAPAHDATTTSS
jgi:hypothetical protein